MKRSRYTQATLDAIPSRPPTAKQRLALSLAGALPAINGCVFQPKVACRTCAQSLTLYPHELFAQMEAERLQKEAATTKALGAKTRLPISADDNSQVINCLTVKNAQTSTPVVKGNRHLEHNLTH